MFKVNCYSVELSYSTHLTLTDDELRKKCSFEYGVEMVKVFYLGREYIPDRKGVNTNED